jgi:adenylate cyclase
MAMGRETGMAQRRRGMMIAGLAGLVVAAAIGVRLLDLPFASAVRELTFDSFQRLAPPSRLDQPVRVVDIDEASLATYGQWPWPRNRLAALMDRLTDLGAASVAFDIVFAEADRASPARLGDLIGDLGGDLAADKKQKVAEAVAQLPDTDQLFADALARGPSVIGFAITGAAGTARPATHLGVAYAGQDPVTILPKFPGAAKPLAVLEKAAQGIGGISLSSRDSTGIVRRVPLVFSDGEKIYPSLVTEALRIGFGASSLKIRSTGASGEAATGRAALTSLQIGRQVVPTTSEGELWMRFAPDRRDLYLSVRDLLDPAQTDRVKPLVEGHVVFVGTSAAGLQDLRGTALGDVVPGVSIHAQAAAQILQGDFLARPDWADGLEIVASVGAGLLFAGPLLVFGALASLAIGVLATFGTVGFSWWLFTTHGLLVDPLYPLIAGLAAYLTATLALYVTTDRDKRFVRQAFGQYLAPGLLAELERRPDAMKLGGETRDATILFMDVRGFTSLSERLKPDQIVHFLNTLLTPLSDAIQMEAGTIDKYIGDSIMAFWNAPLPVADHPAAACRAALAMRAALARLEADAAFADLHAVGVNEVRIGIGLNTGDACLGNMGSARRFNYSAIGDAVNIAARIESASKAAGVDILVSEATAAAAPDFAYLPVGEMELKGKSRPLRLMALLGDGGLKAASDFPRLIDLHDRIMAALDAGETEAARALLDEAEALGIAAFAARARHLRAELAA